MKIITLVGVLVLLSLEITDTMPKSAVDGSLLIVFILLVAILAAGIHDAWTNRRGVLGWIMSIICAVIGGVLAIVLGGMISEKIIMDLDLHGSLASSQHPMRYVMPAGMMMVTLFGSWIVLQIVNRFRRGRV